MSDPNDFTSYDRIASPIFVLEVDTRGEPVFVAFNSYARQISGRPLSDYLGRTALEVYPQAYGRAAYQRHCEVRDFGQPLTYHIDLPIGGFTRTIRTILSPELDTDGKVRYLFGSSQDITTERQALEAKVQLETLSTEMEQFVALAAHDLRAPMRNIAVIADLLRDGFVDHGDGKVELLDILDNIAIKSMDLITDVLLHVETVAVEPTETVFSFPALCNDICDTLDPTREHDITSSTATLSADRSAMQIAVRNVTENAIKHGGRKPLKIHIDVKNGLPGLLEVTLTDNGKGFSEDALKVMNAGNFRAESGYGLFGIKRLLSARGGTLIARNLPSGTGATVRFSLPGSYIFGEANKGLAEPCAAPLDHQMDMDGQHTA